MSPENLLKISKNKNPDKLFQDSFFATYYAFEQYFSDIQVAK